MKASSNELIIAFLFGSLMLALIGGFMFMMVVFYQKRKIKAFKEQQRLRTQYEQSVLKAKVEIREETLKYVGQELHDNIGQMLSLIKLYLSKPTVKQTTDIKLLIDQAITDIRKLSQDLNINRVEQYTLKDFIEQELSKVHKAGGIKTHFVNEGYDESLNTQTLLMISRIFQECINNIIRHAEAKNIFVKLAATKDAWTLSIEDDGIGFEADSKAKGSGLVNIYDRSKLIGGEVQVSSVLGSGTHVLLIMPKQ